MILMDNFMKIDKDSESFIKIAKINIKILNYLL
jgi:hypothetical protein